MTVTRADLVKGLMQIGATGRRVIAHASLSSFGRVEGGAETVVDALCGLCDTVLVPTFTFSPAAIPPPDDRPEGNGADYERDRLGDANPMRFSLDLEVARPMGVVPEALRRRAGAVRGDHPLSSFAAVGIDAARYVRDYDWADPMKPLARLRDDGGWVLMLGTDLRSCTTIHLGEEQAGRRPFVRWAMAADGRVHRVGVGGCSDGFDALEKWLDGGREARVGQARIRSFAMPDIIDATLRCLSADRFALACPSRCRRCVDAAEGRPAGGGT